MRLSLWEVGEKAGTQKHIGPLLQTSFFDALWLFQAPLLGGVGIALLSGPLGALLVWQRLAYLGDALAHTSLLGVGIALLCGVALLPLTLILTLGIAFILHRLLSTPSDVSKASPESLLLLLSQGIMGVGLLLMNFSHLSSVDLMAYLTGDFLVIDGGDVAAIWGVVCAFGLFLYCSWSRLLALVIHPELAAVEGIPVHALTLLFLIFASVILVFTTQTTGVLLVSALLVFPILILRPWTKTPKMLCLGASAVGVLAVLGGLGLSILFDLPTGPLISVLLFSFFALSRLILLMGWLKESGIVKKVF